MRIATWNVNSIRQRLDHLLAYLKVERADVLCLQELKCLDDGLSACRGGIAGLQRTDARAENLQWRRARVEAAGRRHPARPARRRSGTRKPATSKVLSAMATGVVRIASIYLPNGNPTNTEKYPYKLGFMDRLIAHASTLIRFEEALVLAGDYNVIPEPRDAADPEAWTLTLCSCHPRG